MTEPADSPLGSVTNRNTQGMQKSLAMLGGIGYDVCMTTTISPRPLGTVEYWPEPEVGEDDERHAYLAECYADDERAASKLV